MKLFDNIRLIIRGIFNNQKLLFVLCVIALSLPNVCLFFTERMSLLARVCNVVLPVGAYWRIMTLSRKPGKAFLWLFPLVFLAAFQIVLLSLFGNSVIAVDMYLNLVTTNPTEACELLSNIYLSVVFVVVVYVPLVLWSMFSLRKEAVDEGFIRTNRKWANRCLLMGIVSLVGNYVFYKDYEFKVDLYPVNVMYNAVLAVERNAKSMNYHITSRDFTFNAESKRASNEPEVYVLVIGETARAANLGIYGYERNTTPLMEKLRGLVVFNDVFTQSNTTHKSVPMLLSAVSADNFNDIYKQKSVITAFKEAGYSTAYFSNQRRNHSLIDFFGEEADVTEFIKDSLPVDANVYDAELLGRLKRFLATDTAAKRFVVLHTYGSHFNYRERYPADKAYYKPDMYTSASQDNRATLINAYDNTIRATDEFLNSVVCVVDAECVPSAVVYVSDHGEDIYDDDGKHFLHASPIPSYNQLRVPLLVWTSQSYDTLYPSKRECMLKNADEKIVTGLVVFHTLLDLADISTFYKKDHCALSNKNYESLENRTYLNDHNKPVPVKLLLR